MAAMDYFRELLSTDKRLAELRAETRPIVGTFCNFVPEELILAADAVPLRLDAGDAGAAEEAERVMPRDACPVAKSSAGLLLRTEGLASLPKLLVLPTPCDAKRKMAASLGLPVPVHTMSLPAEKAAPRARETWLAEVRALADRLGDLTGKAVTRASLRRAIDTTNARQSAFRQLLELRKPGSTMVTGSEVLAVANASFVDDPERFAANLRRLVEERMTGHEPLSGKRVLLTGAPLIHPNTALVETIEEAGLVVVADDLCSGTERLYHPVVPMEWGLREMLVAVAEKALLPSTCPCFTSHEDRLVRLKALVSDYAVDGVIYHNLRTCALFHSETNAVRDALRDAGAPMLEISTDYGAGDSEQIRTRVQAFAEMLGA